MSSSARVGVIGLGIMGGAFARNILKAGFTVCGHDINKANCEKISLLGATTADSARDVAVQSDVIITAMPTVDSFHAVMTGSNGILQSGNKALIVVDCSTLSIDDKTRAHDKLADNNMVLLDCPVSGTGAQAENKDLSVYVSGDKAASQQCQPVLQGLANKTFYVGAFGNGSRMKFIANVLVHIHNVATAEAMVMAMKAGLDPAITVDVIKQGAGNSRIFELRAPMMVDNDYTNASMKMDVWQKDIDVISAFAKQLGSPTPLFNAGTSIYKKAMAQGMDKLDTAAVCRVLENMTDLERPTGSIE